MSRVRINSEHKTLSTPNTKKVTASPELLLAFLAILPSERERQFGEALQSY